jgi:folate-dependent phosphoribosylglycinamide formyltransferase PurN
MALTRIFDPEKNPLPMKVAAFMSGSGTNIIRLIEKEQALKQRSGAAPFHVAFIFSDRSDGNCRGEKIAYENGIPYFSWDIRGFHRIKGIRRTVNTPDGMAARREFDSVAGRLVKAFDIDVIALGGYMSFTTLGRCVNVHPADLSILTSEGKRKYTGDNAVYDAIIGGEKILRSSTLWTDQGVDTGPLLMVSAPVKVELPAPLDELKMDKNRFSEIVDIHQQRLKQYGDWVIFPLTIEMIAYGRFALDEFNNVYVDEIPVPGGYRNKLNINRN